MGHWAHSCGTRLPSPSSGDSEKHHDLLEQDCHYLDKQIAQSLAKDETPNLTGTSPEFKASVQHFQRLRHQNRMDLTDNVTVFPVLSGPVTANQDAVLNARKIHKQAYHSRSFIGNHCHIYLKENMINGLTAWYGRHFSWQTTITYTLSQMMWSRISCTEHPVFQSTLACVPQRPS